MGILRSFIHSVIASMIWRDFPEKLKQHGYNFYKIVNYADLNGHTSQLPFFEDERMFVSAYVELPSGTDMTKQILYRASQLNGYDELTIFSMISGIYGMNLVVEALGEPFNWSELTRYTLFEWIAFTLLVAGISLSLGLVLNRLYVFGKGRFNKRKRKRRR